MPTNNKTVSGPTHVPVYRTAEMVSPMHPDKICDRISDAVLDAHLAQDPDARVAVDVAGGHGTVFVTGEITSKATVTNAHIEAIVNRIAGPRANGEPYEIIIRLAEQSPEIARGVDNGGAGDQGIMVGYACDETPDLLPLEYVLARNLCKYLYEKWPYDGKTQVTTKDGFVDTVVASCQHAPHDELEAAIWKWYFDEPLVRLRSKEEAPNTEPLFILHANPAGDWELGGFDADSGLTGRKLAVDNYGPRVTLGGGAFSGKDPSKVDRSGAYMARKIAIDYLCKYSVQEVYVYLAYAIGVDKPVKVNAVADGRQVLVTDYDLTSKGMTTMLKLKNTDYEDCCIFGHHKLNNKQNLITRY